MESGMTNLIDTLLVWVAVKELKLSYRNMGIQ